MHLFDTHCHLDFNDPELDRGFFAQSTPDNHAAACETAQRFICTTCSPAEYAEAKARFANAPAVLVGCGLHPRWIADGICAEEDVEALCQTIPQVKVVGEIGLDFLAPYIHAKEAQLGAFDRIAETCAREGGKVLSIHALRSADQVLSLLKKHRVTESCQCIMHWFSGSSDQLQRAIKMGCWFSLNDRMLSSKKGREYAKVIPEGRLLLESDLPSQPGENAGLDAITANLAETLQLLKDIKGKDCEALCFENAERLLESVSCS